MVIKKNMIYVIADTHFHHGNIIRYCGRPFQNAQEMDKSMIENWNSVVRPDDQIYVVGDFAFTRSAEQAEDLGSKLNGHKFLIIGNHDKLEHCKGVFHWMKEMHVFSAYNITWVLCHYPMWSWPKRSRGSIHLYGHIHNAGYDLGDDSKLMQALIERYDCFNVGVDVNGFMPINLKDLANRIRADKRFGEKRIL